MEVSVHDNNLLVRGEKKFEREESGRTFFFSEVEYGSFQRLSRLPEDPVTDKIDTEIKDGILRLRIAKAKASQPTERKIAIRMS